MVPRVIVSCTCTGTVRLYDTEIQFRRYPGTPTQKVNSFIFNTTNNICTFCCIGVLHCPEVYMCIVLSRNMGIVSLHFKDSNATCRSFLSLHRFSIRPDAVLVVLIVSIYGTTLLCASFVYKPSSSSSSPSIASSPNKSITCTEQQQPPQSPKKQHR